MENTGYDKFYKLMISSKTIQEWNQRREFILNSLSKEEKEHFLQTVDHGLVKKCSFAKKIK